MRAYLFGHIGDAYVFHIADDVELLDFSRSEEDPSRHQNEVGNGVSKLSESGEEFFSVFDQFRRIHIDDRVQELGMAEEIANACLKEELVALGHLAISGLLIAFKEPFDFLSKEGMRS